MESLWCVDSDVIVKYCVWCVDCGGLSVMCSLYWAGCNIIWQLFVFCNVLIVMCYFIVEYDVLNLMYYVYCVVLIVMCGLKCVNCVFSLECVGCAVFCQVLVVMCLLWCVDDDGLFLICWIRFVVLIVLFYLRCLDSGESMVLLDCVSIVMC